MVSETLICETKRVLDAHKSSEPLNITIEGKESIFWFRNGTRASPKTLTKLILREKLNPWIGMNEDKFIKSIANLITNPPFKIIIKTDSQEKINDQNSFRNVDVISL